MIEIYRYTKTELEQFLRQIEFPIQYQEISTIFLGYISDRSVFALKNTKGDKRVAKLRKADSEAIKEAKQFYMLEATFRFSGGHFATSRSVTTPSNKYHVLEMPWLGHSLSELGTYLDLIQMKYLDESPSDPLYGFRGFTRNHIFFLTEVFRKSHLNFAHARKIIHGDLFQLKSPNNIVYHPDVDKLFPVDAEALAVYSHQAEDRFCYEVDQVTEWMCTNLLR